MNDGDVNVQTTISVCTETVDEVGRLLPPGNYFFTIKRMFQHMCSGMLYNRGEFGTFTFKYTALMKMVAVAQARLARRANLSGISEHMPTYDSPRESEEEQLTCSICHDTLTSVDKKTLPCQHEFHASCIQTWLVRKNTCPLCRRRVPRLPRIARMPPRVSPRPLRLQASPIRRRRRIRRPEDPVTPPARVRNMPLHAYRRRYG